MRMPATDPNATTSTAIAPSNVDRRLECVGGGPDDGERRLLHAGEAELVRESGRYELRAERAGVVLRWIPDAQ